MLCIRAARFSGVLLALGGGLVLFVPAAGQAAGSAAPSHRRCPRGGDRVRVARRRVETGRCRASDAAGGSGRCTSGGASCRKGFPVFPQGLDLAKPVMYLSWTGDVPVVYLHLVPLRCTSHGPGRCDVHRPITSGHRHQAWRRDPGDRVICGRKPVGTVSCSTSAALAVSRRWQLRAAWPLTRRPVPARGTRRSDGGVCSPVVVICRGSSGGRHGSAGWLGCMSDVWQGAIPATTEIPGSRLASRCLCRPSG